MCHAGWLLWTGLCYSPGFAFLTFLSFAVESRMSGVSMSNIPSSCLGASALSRYEGSVCWVWYLCAYWHWHGCCPDWYLLFEIHSQSSLARLSLNPKVALRTHLVSCVFGMVCFVFERSFISGLDIRYWPLWRLFPKLDWLLVIS